MLAFLLVFSGLVGALHVDVAEANSGPVTQIPPVVSMPEMEVTASVSRVNGELWAIADAEYEMDIVHAFGDSFLTENWGTGLVADPSPFVTMEVVYDRLDVQYPVPSGATDVSVKIDDADVNCTRTERRFHLFYADLPKLHWRISSVPSSFSITAIYEHEVSTTSETYAYLGKYAFVIPLGSRYGLQEIIDYSFNEYPWFGNTITAQIKV
jgi:hypothetical protein